MHSMKKIVAILGSLGLATASTATVIACGPKTATLTVLLIPSKNAADLNRRTKRLGELIQEQLELNGFKERVSVKTAQDYNIASRSIASGTAAVAFLPTMGYYLNSIEPGRGTMHQLFQAGRNALKVEYNLAGQDVDKMNRNGSQPTLATDEVNQFDITKTYGPIVDQNEIDTTDAKPPITATYYRGYEYITKKTLYQYYQKALLDVDSKKVEAWKLLIKPDENNKTAIFNNEIATDETSLDAYWQVVWNIFEYSSEDRGLGLATEKTSAAGRVNPIATMMEAYLRFNHLDENNSADIKIAQTKVQQLLKNGMVDVPSYGSSMLPRLIDGTLKTGAVFADARTQIKHQDISVQKALDEITIFAVSHGAINDGAVYSTRYFRGKKPKLRAVQKTFIDLINDNAEAQEIFKENYSHTSYVASPIDDEVAMAEHEEKIRKAQQSIINKAAQDISKDIVAP